MDLEVYHGTRPPTCQAWAVKDLAAIKPSWLVDPPSAHTRCKLVMT